MVMPQSERKLRLASTEQALRRLSEEQPLDYVIAEWAAAGCQDPTNWGYKERDVVRRRAYYMVKEWHLDRFEDLRIEELAERGLKPVRKSSLKGSRTK